MPQPDTPRNLEYLDDLPQGIFILRPDGTIAYWNHCLEEWTGLVKNTIVGYPVKDHFPHLDTPKYSSRFELLFQGGPPAIFASQFHPQFLPCTLPDGQRRIQQTIAKAIWDEPTQEWQALVIIQDISTLHRQVAESQRLRKQAQAENAARKIQQRLLEAMKEIESTFITTGNPHHTFNTVLTQLLAITESAFGFIGEVRHRNGQPYLKTHAINNIAWNQETQALYDRLAPDFEFCNLKTQSRERNDHRVLACLDSRQCC
jgi:PAS domain S-box-containing protein